MTNNDQVAAKPSLETTKINVRLLILVLAVAVFAIVSDQITKWWALSSLVEGERKPLLGDFISLQLVFNPGAAFSLGEGSTWIFTILSVLVIGFLAWYSLRLHSWVNAVVIGLLMGGAAGNLIDRLAQPPAVGRGHVIDFINYNGWFVGNVADIWIVVSAVALIILMMLRTESDGVQPNPNTTSDEDRPVKPNQSVSGTNDTEPVVGEFSGE